MSIPADTPIPQHLTSKKRKAASKTASPSTIHTTTIRHLSWTYLHLRLLSSNTADLSPDTPLDAITARTHLNSALTRFLGLGGAAIPIDILRLDSRASEVWIRVPRGDARIVVEAISGWVGGGAGPAMRAWRIRGQGEWLGALVSGTGG